MGAQQSILTADSSLHTLHLKPSANLYQIKSQSSYQNCNNILSCSCLQECPHYSNNYALFTSLDATAVEQVCLSYASSQSLHCPQDQQKATSSSDQSHGLRSNDGLSIVRIHLLAGHCSHSAVARKTVKSTLGKTYLRCRSPCILNHRHEKLQSNARVQSIPRLPDNGRRTPQPQEGCSNVHKA